MVNKPDITTLLDAGVKATAMRRSAIANNIANLHTPGYRRSDVEFGKLLETALADGDVESEDLEAKLLQPKTTPVDSNGNDVNIDMEVGELMKNDGLQKTYLRVLASKYRQMEMAMRVE